MRNLLHLILFAVDLGLKSGDGHLDVLDLSVFFKILRICENLLVSVFFDFSAEIGYRRLGLSNRLVHRGDFLFTQGVLVLLELLLNVCDLALERRLLSCCFFGFGCLRESLDIALELCLLLLLAHWHLNLTLHLVELVLILLDLCLPLLDFGVLHRRGGGAFCASFSLRCSGRGRLLCCLDWRRKVDGVVLILLGHDELILVAVLP